MSKAVYRLKDGYALPLINTGVVYLGMLRDEIPWLTITAPYPDGAREAGYELARQRAEWMVQLLNEHGELNEHDD